jgi:phosphate transport system substrate-binding protein
MEAEDADAVLLLGKVGDPGLFQTILGQEGLAVIVHPDNTTADMSVEQVRAIFSGEMVSWSELGGSQRPIEIIIEPEGSSTRSSLEALVLGGVEPAPSSRLAPDADTMAELVAASPGAIGWLPSSGGPG